MKRYIVIIAALFLSLFFCGCESGEKGAETRDAGDADFLIVTMDGGIEEETAKMVGAELESMGYSWDMETKMPRSAPEKVKGAVFVGVDCAEWDVPSVRCDFKMNVEAENTLSPCLSSGKIARAATLLLPDAEHFTVFFGEKGASDVQDACDFFDLCGIDYRARALESGEFAECLAEAQSSGSDAVILPSAKLSGSGIEIFGGDCPVLAVGEGETVKGAVATFCIDTEILARDTAKSMVSLINGEEPTLDTCGYYILCISRTLAEKYGADVTAVSEDFRVVVVD